MATLQTTGLTNRRMRARMSGGVRGGRETRPPTRFKLPARKRQRIRVVAVVSARWRPSMFLVEQDECSGELMMNPDRGRPGRLLSAGLRSWRSGTGGALCTRLGMNAAAALDLAGPDTRGVA